MRSVVARSSASGKSAESMQWPGCPNLRFAASAQEAQHPWGALLGCRRSSVLSTALHSLNYTHRNPTLHLGTHLDKGDPKIIPVLALDESVDLKCFFPQRIQLSHCTLYRTCIASKCFLKNQQPLQQYIYMNPSMYRAPALSTASFVALGKSWMGALPFSCCVLKPISCPSLLCVIQEDNSHSMCRIIHRQTPPSLPWG